MLDDISVTSPSIVVNPSILAFSDGIVGTASDPQIVTITGNELLDSITVAANLPFNISSDGVSWDTTCMLNSNGGNLYVRFYPQGSGAKSDVIQLTSTGITEKIALHGAITGIEDITKAGISAYPNPFSDELIIELIGGGETLSVVNAIGYENYSVNIPKGSNQLSIPTSKWSRGVYFVRVKQNNVIKVLKVVKH